MNRLEAETALNELTGGTQPREGDMLVRDRDGWRYLRMSEIGNTDAFTANNVTEDRSFDADATTLDELADVVGTLIEALKSKRIIS